MKRKKRKTLREQKAWEKSVPSHKVNQQEEKVENTFENMLLVEQPSSFLICKGTLACTATLLETCVLPPQVKELLKEFDDIFSKEGLIGLPPFRGIEHQIDLVSGANRTNPEETKEIESQVQDLLEKGWVQKSLSPCVVPVLLVPKKDGKWSVVIVEPSITSPSSIGIQFQD